MKLADYWRQPLSMGINRQGRLTEWLDIAEIEVTTGTLAIGDTMYFPHYQVQVNVPDGAYCVQATVGDYGVERHIARLRAVLKDQIVTRQDNPLGEIPVDLAGVGICDFTAFQEAFETTFTCEDEKKAHYVSHLWHDYGVVRVAGLPMVYTKAGWGDGLYEVYPYVDDIGTIVGIEAVFIEDGPYLMEDVEHFQIHSLRELRDRADERRDDMDT